MTPDLGTFQRLRYAVTRNASRIILREGRLRLLMVVLSCFVAIVAVLSASGFAFSLMRQQNLPGSGLIIGLLFDYLFLSLGGLLIFSGGLILYGSLFASPEAAFLLTTPARADQIFAYKFQAAVGFSSWAFLLLGLPVLIAFGVVYRADPLFYISLMPFLAGYLLLPGSIGALACMLIVNLAPRRKKTVLTLVIVATVFALLAWVGRVAWTARSAGDRDGLEQLLGWFAFARSGWLPNHWMSRGLQAAARGNWVETAYPLCLVWSHGLMAYLIAAATAGQLYRRGFDRLISGGDPEHRRHSRIHWLDRLADFLLTPLGTQTRLLVLKDFRAFRRDPMQWGQVLIFAGLVLLYFLNTRKFYRSDLGRPFQHGVSLTNLAATSMLLCAYLGRFVYPMLSLEGRKFWILGLLPLSRARLMWGKFAFAAGGSVPVAAGLVVVSDILLGLPPLGIALHGAALLFAAAGLSGLAVGLGALVPNFRETDPSKIAVGFGGTMFLLAGLAYLVIVIGLTCGPYHFLAMLHGGIHGTGELALISVGVTLSAILAALTTIIPLWSGAKALDAMEF